MDEILNLGGLPSLPMAFTRYRKFPMSALVALLLQGMRMDVQAELDTIFTPSVHTQVLY
jgi:hypothetical protein